MTKHSIKEACFLAKKSRMTIYRHMSSGKLSYGVEPSGKRFIETSEIIRVYGELNPYKIQNDTKKCTNVMISDHQNDTIGTLELLADILQEIKALRKENKALRKELSEKKLLPPPINFSNKINRDKEEYIREESIKSSLANLRKKIINK